MRRLLVDIPCEVFEPDEAEVKLEIQDAPFNIHLRRNPSEGLQNLDVQLYCAIGHLLALSKSHEQLEQFFRKKEYHCEACMGDIVTTVRQKPTLRKRQA